MFARGMYQVYEINDDCLIDNINTSINICSIELKWDGKKLKYDMITSWGEYK